MKNIPNKFFDLIIADPPYGINQDGEKNKTRGSKFVSAKDYKPYSSGDKNSPDKKVFDEMIRISKNQIIFGANHFISKIPYDSSCWIVWDKNNSGDFADCELAWTSFKTAVRMFKFTWNGMLQENMKDKQKRIHPNEKPIQLYKWIIQKYSKQTDKILDPFMGSQSSRIASYDLKRDYYGCELDTFYFNEGCNNFNKHIEQLTINFEGEDYEDSEIYATV